MDGLDYSGLTDDQLVALLRGALAECAARNPQVQAAAQAAVLDEAERVRIATEAAQREALRLREQARQRAAKEATEQVRRQQSAEEQARIVRDAEAALAADKAVLQGMAAALGMRPSDITVVVLEGGRVIVNEGADRWARDHLVDYRGPRDLSTKRHLVARKPAILTACMSLTSQYKRIARSGADYEWSSNP